MSIYVCLDPDGQPLVDIGAGTGRLTVELARSVAPAEVFAVEPSRGLRAVLTARLAADDDLLAQVTVVPRVLDEALDLLPEKIGGAMAFGVLPHLDPSARARMLAFLADRLVPEGRALVEVMRPWTNDAVPRTTMGEGARSGRHRIDCDVRAEPVGSDGLLWTMSYRRTAADGAVLHEAQGSSRCWVVSRDAFELEAREAGLHLAWLGDDVADLRSPDRI